MTSSSKKSNSLKASVEKTYDIEPLVFEEGTKNNETNVEVFGNKKQKARMQKIVSILEQSEHGKALLEKAKENGYSLGFERGIEDMGVCSSEHKTVTINDAANDAMAVVILAHELRHAIQYSNGMNLYAESDNIKTQIQINRAMEADAETNAAFIALELREKGFKEPWREFKKDGIEVANAIEEEMSKTDGNLEKNKTKILLAGFKGWYNDFNIREQYDSQQMEILDKIREDNLINIIAFDRSCPANIIVRKICKTPELGNYFNDNSEDPKLLDTQHYLGISRANMETLKEYFSERKTKYNIQPDDSLEEIPTYKYINEKKEPHRGNTKSVYWEPIVKIKTKEDKDHKEARENKKQAIAENKKRYIETINTSSNNNSNILLNEKNSKIR